MNAALILFDLVLPDSPCSGMDRFAARQAVWEQLTQQGLAIREEAHVQRVPRSQRGGEVRRGGEGLEGREGGRERER